MTVADEVGLKAVSDDRTASLQRIVWSSVIGTAVEWYDFLIYGTATALVFNKLFFPSGNATLATIAAFGTYAVGFLARPLGALKRDHDCSSCCAGGAVECTTAPGERAVSCL